jgi:hypothetical protein
MIREITSAEGKGEKFPLLLFFWRRGIFSSTTQSNSSRWRCDEIGVFAFDSAQHPAHHSVFCPWSELAPLTNPMFDVTPHRENRDAPGLFSAAGWATAGRHCGDNPLSLA